MADISTRVSLLPDEVKTIIIQGTGLTSITHGNNRGSWMAIHTL